MIGKKIKRIFDVFRIFSHRKGGFGYLRQPNSSIASFMVLDRLSHYIADLGTVIDVGANQGQFACAAARFFPEAVIHSFEPVPDTYDRLVVHIKSFARIMAYNFGLGSESGKIDFYQNEYSHASSALPISDFQKSELPETSKTRLITVPVDRLENVAEIIDTLARPLLLKLDVQGYEKQVLLGAGSFIDKVDYLLFEASFISMYEGESLFEEMHELVRKMGFRLIAPVGSLEIKEVQIVQMDMLYCR